MGKYIAPVKPTDERETPDDLFADLDKEFRFTRDVCATRENRKVQKFFSHKRNALERPWRGVCWMNPPYSKCGDWIRKAYRESRRGATVVCLVPSATDTRWWHRYAVKGEIRFIKGRLKFKGMKAGAPFPSVVIIFRPR